MRCLILVTVLALIPFAHAADEAGGPLVVATRHVPPFAMQDDTGAWHGISVDLWRLAANDLGLDYEFREMGLADMLDGLSTGSVSAAVAALTVTAEREGRFDFSHPFYTAGLGIAVPNQGRGEWLRVFAGLVSPRFLLVVSALLVLLLAVGAVVWLFERRRNPQFGGSPLQGIGSGLWWSAVTMTTVGYGDKSPVTFGGRMLALVWMFAGVIIISSVTAAITTALTVNQLDGKVRSRSDLNRARVVTVSGTTSEEFLRRERVGYRGLPALDEALMALAKGEFDALVYDEPVLRYRIMQGFAGTIRVLPGFVERQDYAIGLPAGSTLRESLNRALLLRLSADTWTSSLTQYLGRED